MTQDTLEPPLDAVAQRFRRVAKREFRGTAPLYESLTQGLAEDADLLALVVQAPAEQQRPTLFLAAVHDLLLQGAKHPLAASYPDLVTAPAPSADPYPVFRAFCLEHRDELLHLLKTRRVQTNEVGRCSALLPVFTLVSHLVGGRPLALVEVGASAGLNLLFDRYAYDYGSEYRVGDVGAAVQLTCQLRGTSVPPLPRTMPQIASRVGIDLAPVDVQDPEATRWLRACVWAEHLARSAQLQRALAIARQAPPSLVAGNALDTLPQLVAGIAQDVPLCLFHSATLAYFSAEERLRFTNLIATLADERDLFWLSSEGPAPLHESIREHAEEWRRRDQAEREAGRPGVAPVHWLILTAFQGGRRTEQPLAAADVHGAWLEWRDVTSPSIWEPDRRDGVDALPIRH